MPFPSPEDLPDPGTESVSPALAGGFFNTEPSGKPQQGITRSLMSEVLSRGNSGLEGFAAPSQFWKSPPAGLSWKLGVWKEDGYWEESPGKEWDGKRGESAGQEEALISLWDLDWSYPHFLASA